jgi:hypothetical protein
MLELLKTMYNALEGIEKVIFIFWLFCVCLFVIFYLRAWVHIIEDKFATKNKPQKF